MKSIAHQFVAGFAMLAAAAVLAIGAMTTNQAMAATAITPDSNTVQTIPAYHHESPAGASALAAGIR